MDYVGERRSGVEAIWLNNNDLLHPRQSLRPIVVLVVLYASGNRPRDSVGDVVWKSRCYTVYLEDVEIRKVCLNHDSFLESQLSWVVIRKRPSLLVW